MKTTHRKYAYDFNAPEDVLLDGLDRKSDNILFIHHKNNSDIYQNLEPHDGRILSSLYHALQSNPTVHLYAKLMEKNDDGGTQIKNILGRLDLMDFEPVFEYDGHHVLNIVSHEVAMLSALLSTRRVFTIDVPAASILTIAFSEEQVHSYVEMLHEDKHLTSGQDIEILSYQRQPDTGILSQKDHAVTVEPTLFISGLTHD